MVRADDLDELGSLLRKIIDVSSRIGDEGLTLAVGRLIEQQQRLKYAPTQEVVPVWKRTPAEKTGRGPAYREPPVAAKPAYAEPLPPAHPYNPLDSIGTHEMTAAEVERLHRGEEVPSFVHTDAEESLRRAVSIMGDKDAALIANYAGVPLIEAQRFLARPRR